MARRRIRPNPRALDPGLPVQGGNLEALGNKRHLRIQAFGLGILFCASAVSSTSPKACISFSRLQFRSESCSSELLGHFSRFAYILRCLVQVYRGPGLLSGMQAVAVRHFVSGAPLQCLAV